MSIKSDQLAAARTAMSELLAGKAQSYTTPLGVSVSRINISELRDYINQLEGEVALEEMAGESGPSRIEVGLSGVDVCR